MCRLRNIAMLDYEECMCHLRNIAMRDYQESVTTGQTEEQTDRRRAE